MRVKKCRVTSRLGEYYFKKNFSSYEKEYLFLQYVEAISGEFQYMLVLVIKKKN